MKIVWMTISWEKPLNTLLLLPKAANTSALKDETRI